MSWTRINHPQEVLKEGQELDVMVLKMDLEAGRVSLGLRQILPDPWTTIDEKYSLGDVINGQVSRVVPFGVFVQLDGGIEGIIPNAELGSRRGKGAPTLNPGDEVEVKVIDLRPDERKMSLSPRQITTTVDGVSTTHEFTDFEPAREPADRGVEPAPERGGEGGGRGGDRGGEGGGRGDRGGRGGEPRPERNRGPRDRGERGGGGGGRDRGDDSYDGGSFDRSYMDRNAEPRFTIGDALRAKEEQERESQEREGGDGDASGEGGGEE
jgi:4-hydroxy-3-methylbut-2-enyl diphosphate reductase